MNDLKENSSFPSLDRENLDDVLAIARDSAVDNFRMFKSTFHEVNDINIKLWAINRKQENQGVKQWTMNQRKSIVDSMQKIVSIVSDMRKDYDSTISFLEDKIKKEYEGRLS